MGYDYLMLAVAILVPLGLFGLLRSEKGLPSAADGSSTKVPGGFGSGISSSKSKKKKNKKKNASVVNNANGTTSNIGGEEDGESDEDGKVVEKMSSKKNDDNNKAKTTATSEKANTSASKETKKSGSTIAAATTNTASGGTNKKKGKKNQFVPVGSVAELEQTAAAASTSSLKAPDQLRFSAAAATSAPHSIDSSSSQAGVSVPGPGAPSGKSRKKGAGGQGSGLSHADFPTLEVASKKRPETQAYKQQEPKTLHYDMLPRSASQTTAKRIDQADSEEEEEHGHETESKRQESEEEKVDEEEWQTIGKGSSSSSSKSSNIDFNKPMDPWVAQQQQDLLARIQEADPHGENTIKVARVLSIKPTVKEEKYREPVPEGFQTQKSRLPGSGSYSSSSSSNEPLTKKQRANLARAARKKEEKAAMDALQEQRRKEHLRQVESERMKEFYRNQNKARSAAVQAAPSKWQQQSSKPAVSNSSVSGGMSAQLDDKGQLVWD